MKTGNHLNDTENSGALPIDPFAVDFFGAPASAALDDEPDESGDSGERRPVRARKKSDWHRNLPQISNREAELSNRLAALPDGLSERAAERLTARLARLLGLPPETVEVTPIATREAHLPGALARLDELGQYRLRFVTTDGAAPATIALDAGLAAGLAARAAGADEAETPVRRELAPIEAAVVEFIAAGLLAELNELAGERLFALPAHGAAAAVTAPAERGAEIVAELRAGALDGIVTLLLPAALLARLGAADAPLLRKRAPAGWRAAERFGEAFGLRVPLGATTLDAATLSFLEPGDIVLVERPEIDFDGATVGGVRQTLVGAGGGLRLRGAAEQRTLDGNWEFRVEEIISEETRRRFVPAKFKMDEQELETAADPAFEDETASVSAADETTDETLSPALENIQVTLRVEIAGSRISLRELQNLRAGQVIGLGCGPHDPVRLVADSREEPLATGELVEIEGQLGVRLTKVFV